MATFHTSHGSPPPGTCHAELSVENKCTSLNTGPTMNQEAGGRGQTKGKVTKLGRAKPGGQNYTAVAPSAGQLLVHLPFTWKNWKL